MARRDRVIASYTLLSAVGRLDVKTQELNMPDYLPELHYHQVRDAWHGLRTPTGREVDRSFSQLGDSWLVVATRPLDRRIGAVSMAAAEKDLRALMLASLDGDAASHRALLVRLSQRLRAYYNRKLASIGRSASEAEDLVQEAILAIHIKRHTYDPTNPFTPWAHAIARHKLIDFLRRTRMSFVNVPLDVAEEVLAHDDHVGVESSYDLRRLLQRLPKNIKCSMEAVKLDGLSVAEAALRCGISESGVKVNIHRGLKTLAVLIAREAKS